MKNRTKIIIGISCLLIATFSYVATNINNPKPTKNDVSVNFSEGTINDDDLINSSDVIMKGKVVGIKERGTRTVTTTSSENKPIQVTGSYVTYLVSESERLSNSKNEKNIELTMIDAPSMALNVGDEHLLFLYKDSKKNNSYAPVSYNNGIYNVNGKVIKHKFSNMSNKDKNYDEIKAEIGKLKNK